MTTPGEGRSLETAVDAFLTHVSIERGLSPRTVDAYGRDLARFAAFLRGAGVRGVGSIRRDHLVAFSRSLDREGLAARSRARCLVSVRRLLRHHGVSGPEGGDPLQGVSTPRFERRLPRVLRPDETASLIEATDPSS
ncbi:MAG TPA: site-specific integrase, partial [Myxococcota bacterium]|nr:site-specific integrase [Myxococcota bacterium]